MCWPHSEQRSCTPICDSQKVLICAGAQTLCETTHPLQISIVCNCINYQVHSVALLEHLHVYFCVLKQGQQQCAQALVHILKRINRCSSQQISAARGCCQEIKIFYHIRTLCIWWWHRRLWSIGSASEAYACNVVSDVQGGMLWECATEQVACIAAISETRKTRQRCAATFNSTCMNGRRELHRCQATLLAALHPTL
jgi:hypothetical protein